MSDDHGLEEARSQFEKIARLVLALQSADVFARQDAEERIHGDAFEVMIRSSWHAPGRDGLDVPIEYCILLCTTGPAVRIVGDLNKYGSLSARGSNIRTGFTRSRLGWEIAVQSKKSCLPTHAVLVSANKGRNHRRLSRVGCSALREPLWR